MAIKNVDELIGQPVVLPVDDPDWISYAATLAGTGSKAFTTIYLKYRQVRNGYKIVFCFDSNAIASGGGSTDVTFPLPSGAVMDTNFLPLPGTLASQANNLGWGYEFSITGLNSFAPLSAIYPASTTSIKFLRGGGSVITSANMNNTNNMQIQGEIWVPIVGLSAYRAYGAGYNSAGPSLVNGQSQPSNLISTDFTSLSNITIDPADVITARWQMVNKRVFLDLILNQVTITASAQDVRFVLPAAIPRPPSSVQSAAQIYDNTSTNGVAGLCEMQANGTIVFGKLSGTFAGGANSSYLRANISWSAV